MAALGSGSSGASPCRFCASLPRACACGSEGRDKVRRSPAAPPVPIIFKSYLFKMARCPRLLELFSGTGSIGKTASLLGFEVVSVDLVGSATVRGDITNLDLSLYGIFDWIHASPPCTEYSIAKTRAPRDLDTANSIAGHARRIIDDQLKRHPTLAYTIENPATGLLKTQPPVEGLEWVDVDYCCFGYPYRKATRIWSNVDLSRLPRCSTDCQYGGKHPLTVESSPVSIRSRIPPGLCFYLTSAVMRHLRLEMPRVIISSTSRVTSTNRPSKSKTNKICQSANLV